MRLIPNAKIGLGKAAFAAFALAIGCCLFQTFGREAKASDDFYFVDTGNATVRMEGTVAEAPMEAAVLLLEREDGTKIVEYHGDAGFLYLMDSAGKKFKEGEEVEKGATYSAVWGQSKIELPNYYERGWQFNGWVKSKDSSIIYEGKEQYIFSACTTLYPVLTGNKYTISFSNNSDAVSVEFGKRLQNVSVTDSRTVFMDGDDVIGTVNRFIGYWYGEKQYYDSAGRALSVWDVPSDAVLDAHFIESVDAPAVQKKGYEFAGWSQTGKLSGVTDEFQDGVYYAVFEPKSYSVKIGGKTCTAVFGKKLASVDVPFKFGYRFTGYYLKDDKEEVCLFDGHGKCIEAWRWDDGVSVFARWSKIQFADKITATLAKGASTTFDLGDKISSVSVLNKKCSYSSKAGSISVSGDKIGVFKCIVVTSDVRNTLLTVTVKKQPKKVSVGFVSKKLKVGRMIQLKPSVGEGYYSSYFYYKSSRPSVASVNTRGYVEALRKGEAVITITTSNNKKCKVRVTVC